jgi:hypothetical protein
MNDYHNPQGQVFYKLHDAVKAAEVRTKGGGVLYIYPRPSVNGLFVDWVLSALKYSAIKPTITVTDGKED